MATILKHRVSADAALAKAEDVLLDQVGDLLIAENPTLVDDGRPRWVMSVILGNAVRGRLGQVGWIAVDAESGEPLFGEDERAAIIANAERLSRPAASWAG